MMNNETLFLAQKLHAALAEAAMLRRSLDQAWEEIHALGGHAFDEEGHIVNMTVLDALRIIEKLGGRDPLQKEPAE